MASRAPRNGLLSGMIITGLAAVAALPTGLTAAGSTFFTRAPSEALLDAFGLSILVMIAHKAESYLTGEYDVCPVYLASQNAPWGQNPRKALFAGFVSTFLGMMILVYGVMRGGPWPMLGLGVWLAQGLHELHHAAKTLAQRSYYAGTVTGLLFVATMDAVVWPAWAATLELSDTWTTLYLGVQPLVFVAFFLEHRGWLAQGGVEARLAVRVG